MTDKVKFLRKRFLLSKGFTLMEVMILVALSSILVMAIAAITNFGTKGQKALQSSDDARALANEIEALLTNSAACAFTFATPVALDPTAAGQTVSSIKDSSGVAKYQTNSTYANRTVKLNKITVGGGASGTTEPQSSLFYWHALPAIFGLGSTGDALVRLEWSVTGASGPQLVYTNFIIHVGLSSGKIQTCVAHPVPDQYTSPITGSTKSSSGAGTAFKLPLWTGGSSPTTSLGDSAIFQSGVGATAVIAINTVTPVALPGVALDVEGGTVHASGCIHYYGGTLGGVGCVSDERLKTDIRPFTLGLDALLGIQPHYFRFNGLGGQPVSEQDQLGVIAQEVEKVAPELISTRLAKLHPEDKEEATLKVMNYGGLRYILINAVKELYHRWQRDNFELAKEMEKLQEENAQLTEENASLDALTMNAERNNAALKATLCKQDPSAGFCP